MQNTRGGAGRNQGAKKKGRNIPIRVDDQEKELIEYFRRTAPMSPYEMKLLKWARKNSMLLYLDRPFTVDQLYLKTTYNPLLIP